MRLPRFLRRSVRGKMLAVVLATAMVALLVNALALLYYNVRDYRETQLADLRTQAEILGRASAASLAFNDRREAENDLATLQARPDVEMAAHYDPAGALFAAYVRGGDSNSIPPRAQAPGYRISENRLTLFHPIAEKGDSLGTVYLRAEYGLRDRILAYLGIVALVLGGALAAARFVAASRRLRLRPPPAVR